MSSFKNTKQVTSSSNIQKNVHPVSRIYLHCSTFTVESHSEAADRASASMPVEADIGVTAICIKMQDLSSIKSKITFKCP